MQFSKTLNALAVLAIAFGALTILSGGRALFGGADAQAAVGNAVPFVLWFNFVAGFGYVLAGVGLWLGRRCGFDVGWRALRGRPCDPRFFEISSVFAHDWCALDFDRASTKNHSSKFASRSGVPCKTLTTSMPSGKGS